MIPITVEIYGSKEFVSLFLFYDFGINQECSILDAAFLTV